MKANQPGKVIQRKTLVTLLQTAVWNGETRFARQAALAWLAAFPGDLEVSLLHALALKEEGRIHAIIPSIELLCAKDPFFDEAYRLLAAVCQEQSPQRYTWALTNLFVLNGVVPERGVIEPWGAAVRQAYLAYQNQQLDEAQASLQQAFQQGADLPLAAALHVMIVRAGQPASVVHPLAAGYHAQFPECLPISLMLAETWMDSANEPEAVRLLHACAASDTTGQTARRLWGENHAYRALWPDDLVILFDQPIPAAVAGPLGWNNLPTGTLALESPAQAHADKDLFVDVDDANTETAVEFGKAPVDACTGASAQSEIADRNLHEEQAPKESLLDVPCMQAASPSQDGESTPPEMPQAGQSQPRTGSGVRSATDKSVGGELDRLAKKLKQPGPTRADGRAPVYVIVSSREGLASQYGEHSSTVLQTEFARLAGILQQRQGWSALVYFPDDAESTARYGLTPVNPRDPWKVKNALADLDHALAQQGQMIGALLIVGGDAVVPFHRLPNPTDDDDHEVISDSPYGTLDANYFVPEWPVGRLPGEKGTDPGALLENLRRMQRYHLRRKAVLPAIGMDWWVMLRNLFKPWPGSKNTASFGYTAAVWRRSSLAVFRPIGAPHTVVASPPLDAESVDCQRVAFSDLGYYNLHGVADSAVWYGQRDPMEKQSAPDYPVALTPQDLHKNGHAPRVIYSEACYGGHVFDKGVEESLALKFLSVGVQAVVVSTGIAYGSVNTPLIGADLLGNLFWQHLKAGQTAGDALLRAKADLVRQMNARQGCLDGEDQKTLISFVLFGDPLAVYDRFRIQRKATPRSLAPFNVRIVRDQPEPPATQLSGAALQQVKQLVAEYLPGADFANLHLAHQSGGNPNPQSTDSYQEKVGKRSGDRLVVTISKQVMVAEQVHKQYARVTLDEGGNPVKFAISR